MPRNYMLPVEELATRIKIFDWCKLCLIASSETLDCLVFSHSCKLQLHNRHVFDPAVRRSPWSLDQLSKGLWSLDPVHKNFNTGYTSDYHLSMLLLYPVLKPGSSYHGMIDMSSVFIIDGRVLSCLSNLFSFLFCTLETKFCFSYIHTLSQHIIPTY